MPGDTHDRRGHGGVGNEAVEAWRADYLSKPLDFDRLRERSAAYGYGIARRQRLLAADMSLPTASSLRDGGTRTDHAGAFDLVRRLAPHARTALITGETARAKSWSRAPSTSWPRKDRKSSPSTARRWWKPWRKVSCSATCAGLHGRDSSRRPDSSNNRRRDAVLDEIGGAPADPGQALRVHRVRRSAGVGATDSRKVDVRLIAATNRRLPQGGGVGPLPPGPVRRHHVVGFRSPRCVSGATTFVSHGRFRPGVLVTVPETGQRVESGAERLWNNATWNGNIRELRNVIERACMLSDGRILSEREVLAALRGTRPAAAASPTDSPSPEPDEIMPEGRSQRD